VPRSVERWRPSRMRVAKRLARDHRFDRLSADVSKPRSGKWEDEHGALEPNRDRGGAQGRPLALLTGSTEGGGPTRVVGGDRQRRAVPFTGTAEADGGIAPKA
jgi:hypothetical protein